MSLLLFCFYKQISAVVLSPDFAGWLAPLRFNPTQLSEFASLVLCLTATWVASGLVCGGYKTSATSDLPSTLTKISQMWLATMPVVAAQLVLATAVESRCVPVFFPGGGGGGALDCQGCMHAGRCAHVLPLRPLQYFRDGQQGCSHESTCCPAAFAITLAGGFDPLARALRWGRRRGAGYAGQHVAKHAPQIPRINTGAVQRASRRRGVGVRAAADGPWARGAFRVSQRHPGPYGCVALLLLPLPRHLLAALAPAGHARDGEVCVPCACACACASAGAAAWGAANTEAGACLHVCAYVHVCARVRAACVCGCTPTYLRTLAQGCVHNMFAREGRRATGTGSHHEPTTSAAFTECKGG